MKWKMLISEPVAEETLALLKQNDVEVVHGEGLDTDTVLRDLTDCDAVMVRVMKITRDMMLKCPKLKVIAKHGVGCDSIDTAAAKELGIPVVYTPGANGLSVAEHTMALMLACARQLRLTNRVYAAGNMKIKDQAGICELHGKTLALVGCGRIAQQVARMAHDGFDMHVTGYDPYLPGQYWPEIIERKDSLEQLIPEGDFISLHVPATKENNGLIGRGQIALMKKSACLINTARGSVIDQTALTEAVRTGQIAGAGLDVCDPEPAPVNSELFALDRVLLTPHSGAASRESMVRMGLQAAQGAIDVLNGRKPEFPFRV